MSDHLARPRPGAAERCRRAVSTPAAPLLAVALAAALYAHRSPPPAALLASLTYVAAVLGLLHAFLYLAFGNVADLLRGAFLRVDALVLVALACGTPTRELNAVVLLAAAVAALLTFGTRNPRSYAFATPALLTAAALVTLLCASA